MTNVKKIIVQYLEDGPLLLGLLISCCQMVTILRVKKMVTILECQSVLRIVNINEGMDSIIWSLD